MTTKETPFYKFITENFKPGLKILELGSGSGTKLLSEFYTMYSIEDESSYINSQPSTYFYAPYKSYDNVWTAPDGIPEQNGWYDPSYLINLPTDYDLILVDGPNGMKGRAGFLKHLDLFKTNIPIIFDDIYRKPEMLLMEKVVATLNKTFDIYWVNGHPRVGCIR